MSQSQGGPATTDISTAAILVEVAAVEFLAEETVEQPSDAAVLTGEDVDIGPVQGGSLADTIERANEMGDS